MTLGLDRLAFSTPFGNHEPGWLRTTLGCGNPKVSNGASLCRRFPTPLRRGACDVCPGPQAKGHRSRAYFGFPTPRLGFKGSLRGRTADDFLDQVESMEAGMIRCDELVGKTIESCSLYREGPYGPEILIEFTDGTMFNSCLKTSICIEARLLQKTAAEAEVLKDFVPD